MDTAAATFKIYPASIALTLIAVLVFAPWSATSAHSGGGGIVGTYFVVFELRDLAIPSVATFHHDGSFENVDATDFGGFATNQDSALLGSWESTGRHAFKATGIVLTFENPDSAGSHGTLASFNKLTANGELVDGDRIVGVACQEILEIEGGVFDPEVDNPLDEPQKSCPEDFEPDDILPFTGERIRP